MRDEVPVEEQTRLGNGRNFTFSVIPAYPMDNHFGEAGLFTEPVKRSANPACRLRYGRGGRCHLEMRKRKARGAISCGVVSDSETDDEVEEYYPVSDRMKFEYRCALNSRARPDGMTGERRQWPSGDQSALVAASQAASGQQQQLNGEGVS